MILSNIILFLSIINFIVTLFVFLNAKKEKANISFLIFSFITTIWLFDNFLLRIFPYSIYGPLSYGFGILVATFALVWVYNLVGEKLPLFISCFIIPFSFLVFFISSFTNYVVPPFAITNIFRDTGGKGILFLEYSIYIGVLITASLYKLCKGSIGEKDAFKKKQIFSVFIGSVIFGFFAFTVDFLIPLFFNTFDPSDFVGITYFPLLLFIVYSTFRHQLFGIKIIITQLLAAIFLSLLLLNFLLSESLNGYYWNGFLLLGSALLSYLIIKNMFKEIEFNKKLLEEAQKNLDFEKRLKEIYTKIAKEGNKFFL